jgi:hypothetical protein
MFDPLFQAVDLGLLEPVKERFISEIESIAWNTHLFHRYVGKDCKVT